MSVIFVMDKVFQLVNAIVKVMLKTVKVNAEVDQNSTNVMYVMGQESLNHLVTVREIP